MPQPALPAVGVVFRPQLPPERLGGVAVDAEAAGLDELWLWEDCFAEGGLTTAALALAATERVRVGLGLMPVPLRNPALAAMEVAVLARVHPGRFLPGWGHGVLDWMAQVGARAASPVGLLREHLDAVGALLRGERVERRGPGVVLDGVQLAWPPDVVPPVLVGARGPRTLALAGELGDGVILDAGPDPASVRASLDAAGGGPGFAAVVFVPAATGPAAAERLDAEGSVDDPARGRCRLVARDPGDAGDLAAAVDLVRRLHAAGATSVVLQPAGDGEDVAAVVALAGAVRAALHRAPR